MKETRGIALGAVVGACVGWSLRRPHRAEDAGLSGPGAAAPTGVSEADPVAGPGPAVLPIPRERRRGWVVRMAAGLAALMALPSIVLGGHDSLAAASMGQRLIGVLLLSTGLALLAGALVALLARSAGTVDESVPSAATALLLLGVLPGLLLVALQLSSPRSFWALWLVGWLLVAAAPAAAGVMRWRLGSPPRGGRLATGLVSAGIVVALGQSALTNAYTPVKRSESLVVSGSIRSLGDQLTRSGAKTRMRVLEVEISLDNRGDARLILLAGGYSVSGYVSPWRAVAEQQGWPDRAQRELAASPWTARYQTTEEFTLIEVGRDLVNAGDWIAPGQQATITFLAYAPPNTYDGYTLDVALATGRADRLDVDVPNRSAIAPFSDDPAGLYSDIPIRETSWVNKVTRDDDYVRSIVEVHPGTVHPITVDGYVDSARTSARPYSELNRRWQTRYGINFFFAQDYCQDSATER